MKSSEMILEMVGEVLQSYMHRSSKSCPLVLWQVETKILPYPIRHGYFVSLWCLYLPSGVPY